jgi:hypothetical protein
MKRFSIAIVAAGLASSAAAACTTNDVHEKMSHFVERYKELAQKRPDKVRDIAARIQTAMERYRQAVTAGNTNYAEICKLYDDMNAELDKDGA